MSLPASRTLLVAIVLAACGTAPIPTQTPNFSLAPSMAGWTPLDTPTARPIPTAGYVPPTVAAALQIDGLAQVEVRRLRQVVDPDNPNANPRQNRALDALVDGDVVLLIDGPRSVGGRDFWQVFDDTSPMPFDDPVEGLGWVPAVRDGVATLTPFQPECPLSLPSTAPELEQLQRLSPFTGYSCFGSRELMLRGRVHCYESIGDGILGAPFFDGRRSCTLDEVYLSGRPIFDLLPDESGAPHYEIEGDYELRGQFDHPDSRRCTWIPFGTDPVPSGPPDPGAVASCRLFFVVTAVEEL